MEGMGQANSIIAATGAARRLCQVGRKRSDGRPIGYDRGFGRVFLHFAEEPASPDRLLSQSAQGIARETCRSARVKGSRGRQVAAHPPRLGTWCRAYRKQCFLIENRHALEPPLEKRARTFSSRLAIRESGSLRHFMNQLRLCRRTRAVATQSGCLRRSSTQALETGSGCRDLSRGGKSRPRAGRPLRRTNPPRPADRAAQAHAGDCPSPRTLRPRSRRFQQVRAIGGRSKPCGRSHPRPVGMRGGRSG